MKYHQLAENVIDTLNPDPDDEDAAELYSRLRLAQEALVDAEAGVVAAYSEWRTVMQRAASLGNELAIRYVEETTWDLT
jgi:hypothetical protein